MAVSEATLRHLRAVAAASAAKLAIDRIVSVPKPPSPTPPAHKRPRLSDLGFSDSGELPHVQASCGSWTEPSGQPCTIVEIPDDMVGLVIGKGGAGVRHVQAQSGATVQVGKLPADGLRRVCLSGDPASQSVAQEMIEHIVRSKQDQMAAATEPAAAQTTSQVVEVPARFIKMVIGRQGDNIRRIKAETGAGVDVEKEAPPDAATRSVTITGTEEAVTRARTQLDLLLLELYRRHGIFNAPLEEKFAAEADRGLPETRALASNQGLMRTPPMLPGDAPTSGLDGEAAGMPMPPAMADGAIHARSMGQAGGGSSAAMCQGPALSAPCGAPTCADDVLQWAFYFASDPAYVEYYRMLKSTLIQG